MSRTVRVWQCMDWEFNEYACYATRAEAIHAFPEATVYKEGEAPCGGMTIEPITVTLNAKGVAIAMGLVPR